MQVHEDTAVQDLTTSTLYAKQTTSPVRELKWTDGLDYAVAASDTEVSKLNAIITNDSQ